MRVLHLSTNFFNAPMDGGQLRTWHLARLAAMNHEVFVLGMHLPGNPPTEEALRRTREQIGDGTAIERPYSLGYRVKNALLSLAGGLPYTVRNYRFARFEAALCSVLDERKIDLVHAHHPHTAQHWGLFGGRPCVYDAHNVYEELWRGFAERNRKRPHVRLFALRQAALVHLLEADLVRRYDATTVCSGAGRARALEWAPDAAVFTIPNGVDCKTFTDDGQTPKEPFALVYTAALNAPANIDACVYFCTRIFPGILQRFPKTHLYLAGRDPGAEVLKLARSNISVHANVPDVRPYQARAQVFVVPLRIGSGTRLKILEAMSMGAAIVSTTRGAEGIHYTEGRDLLIADTPETFVAAVGRVFENVALRDELGRNGRAFVTERYDWDSFEPALREVYQTALKRRRQR